MPEIQAAQVCLFYLFDVAETFDLDALPGLIGGASVRARFAPKPAAPAYIQYDRPPVSFDGDAVGVPGIEGFRIRLRAYDYGVLSVGLSRPFEGSWADFVALGQKVIDNPELEQRAEQLCRTVLARLRPALTGSRERFLFQDHVV